MLCSWYFKMDKCKSRVQSFLTSSRKLFGFDNCNARLIFSRRISVSYGFVIKSIPPTWILFKWEELTSSQSRMTRLFFLRRSSVHCSCQTRVISVSLSKKIVPLIYIYPFWSIKSKALNWQEMNFVFCTTSLWTKIKLLAKKNYWKNFQKEREILC